jgi:hypothetical protein
MAKKHKQYAPKEPGQQFAEIEAAQRKLGRSSIQSIQGSKSKDKQELQRLAEEALEKLRRRKQKQGE